MKNRWKHIFIPVLTMALCLSLAACGNSDNVAGDDWRTTGMVVGSGTITHDGESVDVLVTVSESSAAFYRDLPEQVLFDSVSFPMNIPDAEQAFTPSPLTIWTTTGKAMCWSASSTKTATLRS